jgi:hypothetical protein
MPGVRLDVETLKPKQGQYLALPTSTRAFMCRQNVRFAGSAMVPRDGPDKGRAAWRRDPKEAAWNGEKTKNGAHAQRLKHAANVDWSGRPAIDLQAGGSVLKRNALGHCDL